MIELDSRQGILEGTGPPSLVNHSHSRRAGHQLAIRDFKHTPLAGGRNRLEDLENYFTTLIPTLIPHSKLPAPNPADANNAGSDGK